MVFFALVTACRLAGAPTRISPSSMYATIEGVVRAPSEFSITFGLPPSMMATHELVVPRSMPMIFAMLVFSVMQCLSGRQMGISACRSTAAGFFAAGNGDERGPQDAIVDEIALLIDIDDGVGGLRRRHHLHRLMAVRVELLA